MSVVNRSRASDEHPGVTRPGPGGDKRRGTRASPHEACEAMRLFLLPCAAPGVSLLAVWCLSGATPRGPPETPAVTLPHGCDGLRARRIAVLWACREPSLGRHVRRACMRNAWLDCTPIRPATACHQSNDVETDRRCSSPQILALSHAMARSRRCRYSRLNS